MNGTLDFASGVTEASILVQILSDAHPEELEEFTVLLQDPLGDTVFVNPSQCSVTISANDDHNGVLSLQSLDGKLFPIVRVNEDDPIVASFTVVRSGGTFGEVSVNWELTRNSTTPTSRVTEADIDPVRGMVFFQEGDRDRQILLTVIPDGTPEYAELYMVQLVADSVLGGARAEGILQGQLIVEDSDKAHGVVQFTNSDAQSLEIVGIEVLLHLVLVSIDAVQTLNAVVAGHHPLFLFFFSFLYIRQVLPVMQVL